MARPSHAQWSTAEILIFAWLAGAALVSLRSVVGFIVIRRLLKRATAKLGPEREPVFKELLQTLAPRRNVTVRVSDRSVTPMTVGMRSAAIILPAEANNWLEERLRFVLAHELAHVKRRDTLMQVPIQIACSLHWFNPLVWIAHRRFLIERERACDDFVINSGARPDAYAGHLLDIARSVRHKPHFAFSGIFMANRSQLETRLLSILDKNMSRKSPNRVVLALTAMIAITLLIPLATVQLRAQDSKPAAQAPPPRPPAAAPAVEPQKEQRYIISNEEKAAFEKLKSQEDRERFIEQFFQQQDRMLQDPQIKQYLDAERQYQDSIQDSQKDAIEQALRNYREAMKESQFGRDQLDFNSAELGRQAEMVKERMRELGVASQGFLITDPKVWDALQALGLRANPEHVEQAIGPLTNALQDSNAEVRRAAARALGELRDQRAVAPLLKALADQDAEVRESAAEALGEIRDTTAASALIQAVKDPNPGVRKSAILALANMRSTDALNAILAAMKDADPAVRKAAVEALAQIVKQ
jgi:beta-lactamase regulating signal transducer with metallopeptidase domain